MGGTLLAGTVFERFLHDSPMQLAIYRATRYCHANVATKLALPRARQGVGHRAVTDPRVPPTPFPTHQKYWDPADQLQESKTALPRKVKKRVSGGVSGESSRGPGRRPKKSQKRVSGRLCESKITCFLTPETHF